VTPDDAVVDAIEAVAFTAAAVVVAGLLGAGFVVRALQRRWTR